MTLGGRGKASAHLREAILMIDPAADAPLIGEIPQQARKAMLRYHLAEFEDDDTRIRLTAAGEIVRQLLLELDEMDSRLASMKTGAISRIAGAAAGLLTSTAIADEAVKAPKRALGRAGGQECGTQSSDSFDRFLAGLNAAGKNRWSMDPKHASAVDDDEPPPVLPPGPASPPL